jgi:hypothetical protein
MQQLKLSNLRHNKLMTREDMKELREVILLNLRDQKMTFMISSKIPLSQFYCMYTTVIMIK